MFSVSELFYSLQGEGLYAGMPSYFIRFTGCNLACTWCDTPYASRTTEGDSLSLGELLSHVEKVPETAHVVLTGGEPMLQKELHALCKALAQAGREVTIETNGTYPPRGIRVALASLSPKLPGSQPDGSGALDPAAAAEWMRTGNYQFKFVVRDGTDVEAAAAFLDHLPIPWDPTRVFLMPEGREPEAVAHHTAAVVEECLRRGLRYGRRLQLDLFGDKRGT
jgi:7-carboxy-7-deazaguanine synthase